MLGKLLNWWPLEAIYDGNALPTHIPKNFTGKVYGFDQKQRA